MAYFVFGQELSVPRATRGAHSIELLLEPSNVVLGERETEGEHLFRWGRAIHNETIRDAIATLDDMHLALNMGAGLGDCEQGSEDQNGLDHLRDLGKRQYL